jgi:hypothetical protein
MPRAHLYMVAQDPAGNALENATVRILQPGTVNPIASPIYATDTDTSAMSNPFTTASGVIDFYIDTAQRVRIGVTPVSAVERFIEDIDIGSTGGSGGGDSDHVGSGSGSTKVGLDATSDGPNSLALAQQANASGDNSTAVGFAANASGLNSTAIGSAAVTAGEEGVAFGRAVLASSFGAVAVGSNSAGTSLRTTAVGDSAVANAQRSTALGANSTGGHDHATAIGSEAVTTEPNQIILGTSGDVAEAPGGYVLTAPDGKKGRLRMLPDGTLTTVWHVPAATANLLPVAEQDFETGIGSWAAVSGLSVAQSADYAFSGANSLKATLSGSGAASARSSKAATTPSVAHVGLARMFYHSGAMTAGLNGTLWLEFYDDTDTLIGTSAAGRTRAFFADAWIWFDVRAVAPASTATVALVAGLPTGGGTSGDTFYIDAAGVFALSATV